MTATDIALDSVEAVAQAFADTWNAHDMAAFASLYADDADFVNVFGVWWRGRDAIRQGHEATHASVFAQSRLTVLSNTVRVLDADHAVCRSLWALDGQRTEDGGALADRTGLMLHVMRRQGGRWWIVASQNTNITPMRFR